MISQPRPEFEKIGQRAKMWNKSLQPIIFASLNNWQMAASFLKDGGYLLANLSRDILLTQSDILYSSGDRDAAINLLEKSLGTDSIRQMAIKNRIESYKLGSDISINEDQYLELAITQTLSMSTRVKIREYP